MAVKGLEGLHKGIRVAVVIFYSIATVLTSINAISRYVFSYVIFGSEELCAYSILLVAFLMFPIIEAKNGHLRIDILDSMSKNEKFKRIVYVIRGIITMGICGTLVFYGWRVTMVANKYKSASQTLKLPKDILFGITTLCFVFAIIGWLVILIFNKRRPI